MSSPGIIVAFDIIKHIISNFFPVPVYSSMNVLSLLAGKETLHAALSRQSPRRHNAIIKASVTSSAVICDFIGQDRPGLLITPR